MKLYAKLVNVMGEPSLELSARVNGQKVNAGLVTWFNGVCSYTARTADGYTATMEFPRWAAARQIKSLAETYVLARFAQ